MFSPALSLILAVLLLSGPGVEELFKADRAFSSLAAQKGTRAAFLEYLAAGAIIFRPEPVDAIAFFRSQTGPEAKLQWEPIRGDISRGQDLGYTTGPWKLTRSSGGREETVEGYYVSIWKKQPAGEWEVVLDAGIPTPPKEKESLDSVRPDGASPPPARGSTPDRRAASIQVPRTDDLTLLDSSLGEAAILHGALAAYQVFSAEDIRIYRPNELPLPGRERLGVLVGSRKLLFSTSGSDVASSIDLGYSYGVGEIIGGDDTQGDRFFAYLHVWQKTGGGWRLALDLRNPLTEEAAQRVRRR